MQKKAKNCSFFVVYKPIAEYMITLRMPKIIIKKISLLYIRMSGKKIYFEDKKIKKVTFIKTKK